MQGEGTNALSFTASVIKLSFSFFFDSIILNVCGLYKKDLEVFGHS
jgi:hypothetical protein